MKILRFSLSVSGNNLLFLVFKGELEGSILYQELLDSAWKFYSENIVKKQR